MPSGQFVTTTGAPVKPVGTGRLYPRVANRETGAPGIWSVARTECRAGRPLRRTGDEAATSRFGGSQRKARACRFAKRLDHAVHQGVVPVGPKNLVADEPETPITRRIEGIFRQISIGVEAEQVTEEESSRQEQ